MKVLWFTNGPLPALSTRLGQRSSVGGGWIPSLASLLRASDGIELAIAAAVPAAPAMQFTSEGIRYYTIAQAARTHFLKHSKANLERARAIVADYHPDIIHVHGTERFYGLIVGMDIDVPVVVSIQGLVSQVRKFLFAGLSFRERLRALRIRDVLRWTGPFPEYLSWRSGAAREMEIISRNQYFIGRTEWDQAWVRAINPTATYFTCDEVIRPVFFEGGWSFPDVKRHSMLCTSAMQPSKGIPLLLDAATILRRKYPDMRLQLAGDWHPRSGWGRVVRHKLRTLGLEDCVTFTGPVDAETLARHLQKANVFVSSSWMENISNSTAEAMLVGIPCVVSFTGGLTTTLTPGETGLMYPPGDPALLAAAVGRIFDDDALALRLASAARSVALRRHEPRRIATKQVEIYREVLSHHEYTSNRHLAGPAALLC
jgi:L-malate glycosyltransferase